MVSMYSTWICAFCPGQQRRSPGPRPGGVRGDVGGLGEAAVGAVPEVERRSDPRLRLMRAVRGVHRPVPVAVDAGGGRGVLRPPAQRRAADRSVDGAQLRGVAAAVLEYLLDARYGWLRACLERFGRGAECSLPRGQLGCCTRVEYEGDPRRRPLDLRRGAGAVRRRRRPGGADPGARAQGRAGGAARRGAAQDGLRVRAAPQRRRAAWIWPTCGATRRRRSSAVSERCSCAAASRRGAARRSGARC